MKYKYTINITSNLNLKDIQNVVDSINAQKETNAELYLTGKCSKCEETKLLNVCEDCYDEMRGLLLEETERI